jgi:hypothetical protein
VWCKYCKAVKKGEEAVCKGLCKACYKPLPDTTPLHTGASRPPPRISRMLPGAGSGRVRLVASDTDSDGDYTSDGDDFRDEQYRLAQQEDDDWRAMDS